MSAVDIAVLVSAAAAVITVLISVYDRYIGVKRLRPITYTVLAVFLGAASGAIVGYFVTAQPFSVFIMGVPLWALIAVAILVRDFLRTRTFRFRTALLVSSTILVGFCLGFFLFTRIGPARGPPLVIKQSAFRLDAQPVVGNVSASTFYAYDLLNGSSQCPLVTPGATAMFIYVEPIGQAYLFIINSGKETEFSEGYVEFDITGVPAGAECVVLDDPSELGYLPDICDLAGGRLLWIWSPQSTDGCVIGPLGNEFVIKLAPGTSSGLEKLVFYYGDANDPYEAILNLSDPVIIEGHLSGWLNETLQ